MATLRKRKVEAEVRNDLELVTKIHEEENLEFCETVRLEVDQSRMLPLDKFMQAIQALNDLFIYYLRSHGYNPDAYTFSIASLQHGPHRIELHHYRKTDVPVTATASANASQPLLRVVKDYKDSEEQIAGSTDRNLFYRFIFHFLEPKLKEILHKAGRKHLGLSSIQLKQLYIFFQLGSIDFYSHTEIIVVNSSNGDIYKLDYNGMQANAIVDQCAILIGSHPDLAKTLNYQIISFSSLADRRSKDQGSPCGIIADISPQPIPVISDDESIMDIIQGMYVTDDLQVPYLVADVQLRLIDNKSVGAYIVQKIHARGKHNY